MGLGMRVLPLVFIMLPKMIRFALSQGRDKFADVSNCGPEQETHPSCNAVAMTSCHFT